MNTINVSEVVKLLLALTPEERKVAIALANTMAPKVQPAVRVPTEAPGSGKSNALLSAMAENVCKTCGFVGYDVRGMHIHAGHVHKGKQLNLKGVK